MQRQIRDEETRGTFLRRGFYVASGLAIAGGVATVLPPLVGAASKDQTKQVLNLLLMIEYAESALYADALKAGNLDSELRGTPRPPARMSASISR